MARSHRQISTLARQLLWLSLLVLTLVARVGHAVTLDEDTGEVLPGGAMTLVEDVSGSWALEDAIAALQSEGEVWDGPGFPVLGFTSSAYWAAVTIDNAFAADQEWLAKMKFATIDKIEMYYQMPDGTWVNKAAGDTLPLANRDIDHPSIIFTVPVFAGQTQTLYFRVENAGSLQLPISLISLEEFQLQSKTEFFWAGVYYGLILIIALYSFFVWVSTKDRSYLYYVLFLISGGLYSFSYQGFAYQYLWPDNPFWANRSILLLCGLASATGLMFVRYFIEVSRVNQALDKLLYWMALVSLAYAGLCIILPYFLLSRFLIVMTLTDLVLISYVSWKIMKRGFNSEVHNGLGR
jgi:hypothetical protein